MTGDLEQLECDIERRLAKMGRLLDVAPSADSLDRVKSALDEVVSRFRRRRALSSYVRVCVGAAAALLLALAWAGPRSAPSLDTLLAPVSDPDEAVSNWVEAMDESGARFAKLLDEGWIFDWYGDYEDEPDSGPDPLDNLEDSFESLERLMGA